MTSHSFHTSSAADQRPLGLADGAVPCRSADEVLAVLAPTPEDPAAVQSTYFWKGPDRAVADLAACEAAR